MVWHFSAMVRNGVAVECNGKNWWGNWVKWWEMVRQLSVMVRNGEAIQCNGKKWCGNSVQR